MKRTVSFLLAAAMSAAVIPAVSLKSEAAAYPEGVTVTADADSPTGYTAHFVYNLNTDSRVTAEQKSSLKEVNVFGSFRYLTNGTSETVDSDHTPYAYQNGDYTAMLHPVPRTAVNANASDQASNSWGGHFFKMNGTGEYYGCVLEMEDPENDGVYTLDMPITSGAHEYQYQIVYTSGSEEETLSLDDPKNPGLCRRNEANSDTQTTDVTWSPLYGQYDSVKQSRGMNLDYETPYTGRKGTVQYVSYTGTMNTHQDLGIYLPAGYDPNREEPYKVIYISHGMGGNETYWFAKAHADNIMDHMIAENASDEAIIVGMDNALYEWDFEKIGENVVTKIIPYMEAHYNVSRRREDRAFAGFSMGAMTTTYMAFHYPETFKYFGIFSGCNIGNATFRPGFTYDADRFEQAGADAYLEEVYQNIQASDILLNNSVIFTCAGNVDTAVYANGFSHYGAYETIRDWCARYMPEDNFIDGGLVHGCHDIYTWMQCLHTFAKDVCWSQNLPMYRLYNPNSGEHFYTSDPGERENVINAGWRDEGIGWTAPADGEPVYRLYNANGGEHHYTTSAKERDSLIRAGWKDEGIGWYSDPAKRVPVYRQYNPNAYANNHNYTVNTGERDHLLSLGWQDESIGWYGVK